jgi:uncharacterized protein (TIGR02597 family)
MKVYPAFRFPLLATAALYALAALPAAVAQSVSTTPIGAVTVNIAAGTGLVRNATIVSFPLINRVVTTGAVSGTITSLTADTLACTGAGWAVSELSQPSLPYVIKITTGVATGRTFLVTANTTDTVTISTSDAVSSTAVDLTQQGIVAGIAGDKFQIENADTLFGLFGAGDTTGVNVPLGNSNPNLADTVQINSSNSFQTYYYDPSQHAWVNLASEVLSNNVVIRPDMAVIYNRLKNAGFSIMVTGEVPDCGRKSIVRSGQTTLLSSYWPVDMKLMDCEFQSLPGWVSSGNPNTADLVQIRQGSSWQTFYHDGSSWINLASEVPSDNVIIPHASGFVIKKRALTGAAAVLSQSMPYSF